MLALFPQLILSFTPSKFNPVAGALQLPVALPADQFEIVPDKAKLLSVPLLAVVLASVAVVTPLPAVTPMACSDYHPYY